jgi:hypothetical protein
MHNPIIQQYIKYYYIILLCLSYYVVSSLAPKLKLSYSLVCPLFLLSQHSSLDFVRSLCWHLKGERVGAKGATGARNHNRLLCFLTGLFLYSHILIQIPVISSPVTG